MRALQQGKWMVLAMDSLRASLDMGDLSDNDTGDSGGQACQLDDSGEFVLPMFHLLDY